MDGKPHADAVVPTVPNGFACTHCRADIRTIPLDGTCANCQHSVADSLRGFSSDWCIIEDRPCLSCGYSLNTMPLTGVCPECGKPVADSIRGNLLVHSGTRYLKRTQMGAHLLLWSMLLSIIWYFVTTILTTVYFYTDTPSLIAIDIAGGLLATGLLAAGMIRLSAPESLTTTDQTASSLKLRWVLTLYCACWMAATLLNAMVMTSSEDFIYEPSLYSISISLTMLIYSMFGFVLASYFTYIRSISLRTPNLPRSKRYRRLAGWAALHGASVAIGVVYILIQTLTPISLESLFGEFVYLGAIVAVGTLIYITGFVAYIYYIISLFQLNAMLGRTRKKRSIALARATTPDAHNPAP